MEKRVKNLPPLIKLKDKWSLDRFIGDDMRQTLDGNLLSSEQHA